MRQRKLLGGFALVGLGMASVSFGAAVSADDQLLSGIALVGGGAAVIGVVTVAVANGSFGIRVKHWITDLTTDPALEDRKTADVSKESPER